MPRVVLDGKLQGVVRKLHRHLGESQMAERNGGAECQSIMMDMNFGLRDMEKGTFLSLIPQSKRSKSRVREKFTGPQL